MTWAGGQRASTQNGTRPPEVVSFFIIQGLRNLGEMRIIAFYVFLLAYIFILVGNGMIIFMVVDLLCFFLFNVTVSR